MAAEEAECIAQENTDCGAATPSPGFCKGAPQTSAAVVVACATDLSAMTCDQFTQPAPANDVCKTQLCGQL